jgi:hypothetical protein
MLQNEKVRLTQRLTSEESLVDWIEPVRMLVLFSNRAVSWFLQGNHEVKRLVLAVAGSNPTLSSQKLSIDAQKPFCRASEPLPFPLAWSLVKDVRTRWREHDPELIGIIAALRQLLKLVGDKDVPKAA